MRSDYLVAKLPVIHSSFALWLSAGAENAAYHAKISKRRATVSILAMSNSVHLGSGSEEVYLANISFHRSELQLTKLVDRYSAAGYPVRISLLKAHRAFKMQLIRQERCDVKGRDFFLPNDPQMIFDTDTSARLKENFNTVIPCYLINHADTRLGKN